MRIPVLIINSAVLLFRYTHLDTHIHTVSDKSKALERQSKGFYVDCCSFSYSYRGEILHFRGTVEGRFFE